MSKEEYILIYHTDKRRFLIVTKGKKFVRLVVIDEEEGTSELRLEYEEAKQLPEMLKKLGI